MTKNEAIEKLWESYDINDAELKEATDMAVKALQKEIKREKSIVIRKYRLSLSVWLEAGDERAELVRERRGAEGVIPEHLCSERTEDEMIDRLCNALRLL